MSAIDRRALMSLAAGTIAAATMEPRLAAADDPSARGEVLGTYTDRFGFERIYVKLRPGLAETDLIAIGRAWHAKAPIGWVWFLDDDEKAKELLESLPETEKGDLSGFPAEWVAAHSLAHIQMELVPGGERRWTLMPKTERTGEPLAVLSGGP